MKNNLLLALAAVCLLGFSSCKKDEQTTPSGSGSGVVNPKKFYLKLDGQEITTEFGSSQHTSGLIIFGTAVGTNTFQLSMSDTLTTGTYPIQLGGVFNVAHSDDNYATGAYVALSGSVTIVSHNTAQHKIAGTFNCNLQKSGAPGNKTVTDGEFNITYP